MAARLLLRAARPLLAGAGRGTGLGTALSTGPPPEKKRWLRAYLELQRLQEPPQRR